MKRNVNSKTLMEGGLNNLDKCSLPNSKLYNMEVVTGYFFEVVNIANINSSIVFQSCSDTTVYKN
jgi:hypothetical protein